MLFCASSQILVSILLVVNMGQGDFIPGVDWTMQLVRFICCSMFHFWFAKKVEIANKSIKYIALNIKHFRKPYWAFLSSILQLVAILVIEVVNIINLCQLNSCIDLLINYIALGFVAEFGSHFLEPFKNTEMDQLIGMTLPLTNFRVSKIFVPSDIVKKLNEQINQDLKDIKE